MERSQCDRETCLQTHNAIIIIAGNTSYSFLLAGRAPDGIMNTPLPSLTVSVQPL